MHFGTERRTARREVSSATTNRARGIFMKRNIVRISAIAALTVACGEPGQEEIGAAAAPSLSAEAEVDDAGVTAAERSTAPGAATAVSLSPSAEGGTTSMSSPEN